MATKTTSSFGAGNASLIAGAAAAYKNRSSAGALNQAVAKMNQQMAVLQAAEDAEKTALQNGIQASVAAIGDVDISNTPPEQVDAQFGYLNELRQNVVNLENRKAELMKNYGFSPNDPQIMEINNEISKNKQGFQQIGKDATKFKEMRQEFIDNGGQFSNGVPLELQRKLKALFAEDGQYTTEIVNGKQVYILEDGSRVTNEELDKYFLQDDEMSGNIATDADTVLSLGRTGGKFDADDKTILKSKLVNQIKAGGQERILSMANDDLIGNGIPMFNAEEKAMLNSNEISIDEKADIIANKYMGHYDNIYQRGKAQHEAEKKEEKVDDKLPKVGFGDRSGFDGRNGIRWVYDGNADGGAGGYVAKRIDSLGNLSAVDGYDVLTNADEANQAMVNPTFRF